MTPHHLTVYRGFDKEQQHWPNRFVKPPHCKARQHSSIWLIFLLCLGCDNDPSSTTKQEKDGEQKVAQDASANDWNTPSDGSDSSLSDTGIDGSMQDSRVLNDADDFDNDSGESSDVSKINNDGETLGDSDDTGSPSPGYADVTRVTVTGIPNEYTFSVEIQSPDTGCEQYADWWEICNRDEQLVYRRILNHSHLEDQQPFTRDGGPVAVNDDEQLVIRAHMNNTGYGGRVMAGSVTTGFQDAPDIHPDFAAHAEKADPQPTECWY